MKVLNRQRGESIMIGDSIKITSLGAKGNEIKIGIEAPRSVKVLRAELLGNPEELERINKLLPYPIIK
jgi:carbon storage regulator